MRVGVSWLREYVDLPAELSPAELEEALVALGLEVESIVDLRGTVTGSLLVGRVLSIEELTGHKRPIRYCLVEVGEAEPRGIICGATNFEVGALVPVILPGGVLPGGFTITARRTYDRVSDGMICSPDELGLGGDHSGIIVLPSGTPGQDARPLVGLDDVVVELEITPDRGYALSVRGIARELSHRFGVPFRDPGSPRAEGIARKGSVGSWTVTDEPAYPVTVEDTVGCDRFAGRVVRGIDPTAGSPQWMKQRLAVAGVRTISLAVDITNYLMLELGQPMHAFDLARLAGPLVVRRARPGERLTTLDGVDRALDPEDMVICDESGPISLAAVMGGETSEVVPGTVDVLFEAAHWDPVMVGRTARRHKLFSEAAKRWERGVDPLLPPVAIDRAVELLTRHGGGTLDERVLDLAHVRPREPITTDADLPARTAGLDYPAGRAAELLTEIGCAVTGERTLTVTPPSWRPDLTDPADLAEEVIRLDGYDKVPSVLPLAPAGGGLTATQRRRRSVGRTLAEAGYVELLSYPFVGETALDALGLPADDPRRSLVRLVNPLSEEEPALRTTLLPPLLATLRRNLGRGHRDAALFELGLVFHPRAGHRVASQRPGAEGGSDTAPPTRAVGFAAPPVLGVDQRPPDKALAAAEAFVPGQPWHIAAVQLGDADPAGWWGPGRPADWTDAVQAARLAIAAAGLAADRVAVRAAATAPWHPGRCAEILVDGEPVGHAGELHPAACQAFDLPRGTCAMELELDALPLPGPAPAPAVSGFPPALIDVALLVPVDVPAAEVQAALTAGAGDLLESVRLFDVYTSSQLGEDRRSLAYRLTFRAADRTLTAQEAVAARDAAVAEAARRAGAVLRGE